jgi:hypothetical protein
MSLVDPATSGLQSGGHQVLSNLSDAPILRQRTPNVDKQLLTPEQAARYTAEANLQASAGAAPTAPVGPATPPAYLPPSPPIGAPPAAPPPAAPALPAAPDAGRVSERIARLFGEKAQANERADQLAAQLADTNRKLDALMLNQGRPSTPNQNIYEVGSQAGTSRPDAISRAELQTILEEHSTKLAHSFRTVQEQQASNSAAERDFPEVYQDAAARAVADKVWRSMPALQADPNGPYLAAAMTRGLLSDPNSVTASAVAAARKSTLSGVGVSVADGNGVANDRVARYEAAMAHARATQRLADFVQADLIRQGSA